MYYITWQFSCFNTEIRVFDYFYIIIFLKLIQTANRRLPYGRRRLLLSLIFSSFPCFPKNLSLILEVIKAGLSVFLAPAFSKVIYAGAFF